MFNVKLNISVIFILLLLSIPACDAPRNNPFDPFNEESPFVILDGKITSNVNEEPLADVKVTFLPYNISAYSNKEGLYFFDYFERTDGWLRIDKQGFFSDSVLIQWGSQKKKSISLGLGCKPKLTNFLYYSVVQTRNNQSNLDNILVKTKITELGNEIDSVYLRYAGKYVKTMSFNIATKFFETTIYPQDLNFTSVDDFIGKQVEVVIINSRGLETTAGILNIQRVIRTAIEPESPSMQEEIYLPIVFKWKKFAPGFAFSYLLQIFTNEIEPQLTAQKAFSSSHDNYTFSSYLNPGEYFWVIWSIDEFGNRNRSKPMSFTLG